MDVSARTITPSDLNCMLFDKFAEPTALPFHVLEEITNWFSDELVIGEGGFAVVYKGVLENGVVAVKKFIKTSMDEKEYSRELECLMQVNHKNIVRFLGYCGENKWHVTKDKGKLVNSNKEHRLLCFEYVPKGSLQDYIKDPEKGLEWGTTYKIIRGICDGLYYLHQKNYVHLDLKPGNILMDENMVPKITDFGLARCFKDDKAHVTATKVVGTMGYMAPEYTSSSKITKKFDLYSLGVVIIQILTRGKGYHAIDDVLASWGNRLKTSELDTRWKQIQVCTEIGKECIDYEPSKRPGSMEFIIERLDKTESDQLITADEQSDLLGVYPSVLCFPFEPNKTISCLLHLTNNTGVHLPFRLMDRLKYSQSFVRVPLYGIVPPKSTYTLVVTTQQQKKLPENRVVNLVLQITKLGPVYCANWPQHKSPKVSFELGNKVHKFKEVTIKAVYTKRRESAMWSKPSSPGIKIFTKDITSHYSCLDANQVKQWIIIGELYGYIRIWNNRTERMIDSVKISRERVTCVKFIARKQWLVAATADGGVRVYDCKTKLHEIRSSQNLDMGPAISLDVHPTLPYLLLAYGCGMRLLDWDKSWKCIHTFQDPCGKKIVHVTFNPTDTIVSASEDYQLKVWTHVSPRFNYTMSGHSNKVNCMHFCTFNDQEYLVTGSDDLTAKLWDLRKKRILNTLKGFISPVMAVAHNPNLHKLILGLKDGSIYMWKTNDAQWSVPGLPEYINLERSIHTGYGGPLLHIACLAGRVVIGQEDAVTIMDIDNASDDEEIRDCCEPDSKADMRSGESASKVNAVSNGRLLEVHQLDLRLPSGQRKPVPSFEMHVRNNTDEDVAFRLVNKNPLVWWPNRRCREEMSNNSCPISGALLYGIVPPSLTYTFVVRLPASSGTGLDLAIQSSTLGDNDMESFKNNSECDNFFEETKKACNFLHELTLEAASQPVVSPEMKTIYMKDSFCSVLCSIDAHPTKPWIVTGHTNGKACIWNYDSQVPMDTVKVADHSVCSTKFVAREKWILARTCNDYIHVYSCMDATNMQKIMCFFESNSFYCGHALAVHSVQPYVLSMTMELLDWREGWKCKKTFEKGFCQKDHVIWQAKFNPNDPDSWAVASSNGRVKVGRVNSRLYSILSGHSKHVCCLDFFTRNGRHYLITGSDDCTAKIWDVEKSVCIHTMEGKSPVNSVICRTARRPQMVGCGMAREFGESRFSLSDNPYLITGSVDGIVRLWSSINFRLKKKIELGRNGPVRGLAILMGSRLVIGQNYAMSIMDIDGEDTDNENSFVSQLAAVLCSVCKTWS